MKHFLFLLITFSSTAALAQIVDPPQTNTVGGVRSDGTWFLGSGQSSAPIDYRQATWDLQQENDRYQGVSRPADCTPVQPGVQTVVPNPCPASSSTVMPSFAPPQNSCNVTYTGISEVTYGANKRKAILLKGQHNAPVGQGYKEFQVLDVDGFLGLAALHSAWQSNLLVQVNTTAEARLPVPDLMSAMTIVAMGFRYHEVEEAELILENNPLNAAVLQEVREKKQYMHALSRELRKWIDNQGRVPAGQIRSFMSQGLERFASTTSEERRFLSQYRDLSIDDTPYLLCDPDAESEMIGQIVCNRNFVDSRQRNPNFCPGGIRFNSMSSLPVCELQLGEGGLCRASLYATSPGVAPVVNPGASGNVGAGAR